MRDWEVGWSHAGLWALKRLPWQAATRVDAAVQAFAARGEGRLRSIEGDPRRLVLIVPPYAVRVTLDPFDRRITVWWVFRGPAR